MGLTILELSFKYWSHSLCNSYLLLLLETVIQYPCLRVYIAQIHVNLSSQFLGFLSDELTLDSTQIPTI